MKPTKFQSFNDNDYKEWPACTPDNRPLIADYKVGYFPAKVIINGHFVHVVFEDEVANMVFDYATKMSCRLAAWEKALSLPTKIIEEDLIVMGFDDTIRNQLSYTLTNQPEILL